MLIVPFVLFQMFRSGGIAIAGGMLVGLWPVWFFGGMGLGLKQRWEAMGNASTSAFAVEILGPRFTSRNRGMQLPPEEVSRYRSLLGRRSRP